MPAGVTLASTSRVNSRFFICISSPPSTLAFVQFKSKLWIRTLCCSGLETELSSLEHQAHTRNCSEDVSAEIYYCHSKIPASPEPEQIPLIWERTMER